LKYKEDGVELSVGLKREVTAMRMVKVKNAMIIGKPVFGYNPLEVELECSSTGARRKAYGFHLNGSITLLSQEFDWDYEDHHRLRDDIRKGENSGIGVLEPFLPASGERSVSIDPDLWLKSLNIQDDCEEYREKYRRDWTILGAFVCHAPTGRSYFHLVVAYEEDVRVLPFDITVGVMPGACTHLDWGMCMITNGHYMVQMGYDAILVFDRFTGDHHYGEEVYLDPRSSDESRRHFNVDLMGLISDSNQLLVTMNLGLISSLVAVINLHELDPFGCTDDRVSINPMNPEYLRGRIP